MSPCRCIGSPQPAEAAEVPSGREERSAGIFIAQFQAAQGLGWGGAQGRLSGILELANESTAQPRCGPGAVHRGRK